MIGFVLAILLTAHGAWYDHYHGANNIPCCSDRDCRTVHARIIGVSRDKVLVEVNGVLLTLPAQSVFTSEDARDYWCGSSDTITDATTRCVFVALGM